MSIDASHTALIIQGFQNDVMSPEGKLYNPDLQAQLRERDVVNNINLVASALREKGGIVAHIPLIAYPNGVGLPKTNMPQFRRFVASGAMIHKSWGGGLWEGIPVESADFVIEKLRVNPFHGSTLLSLLRSVDITTVIPVGTQTNMGIISTARYAADECFDVVALTDAAAANDARTHEGTFEFGLANVATIMDTKGLLEALR